MLHPSKGEVYGANKFILSTDFYYSKVIFFVKEAFFHEKCVYNKLLNNGRVSVFD